MKNEYLKFDNFKRLKSYETVNPYNLGSIIDLIVSRIPFLDMNIKKVDN